MGLIDMKVFWDVSVGRYRPWGGSRASCIDSANLARNGRVTFKT